MSAARGRRRAPLAARPRYYLYDMTPPANAADSAYAEIAAIVRRCESAGRPLWVSTTLPPVLAAGASSVRGADHSSRSDGPHRRPYLSTPELCDVRSLDNLIAHAAADMTVTVQAGMTVARLQGVLAEKRQHLPIDVPRPERTTIGGLIATNLCGSRCFSRGTVRDLLLGIAVVGAGGALIRGGGRVVKNVAGYDLCKLYTGAWNWLGVIVEATLRVAAIPEASAAVAIEFDSPGAVESMCAAIFAGPLRPTTIDLTASQRLRLTIGFEGPREDVAWQTQQLRRDFTDSRELDASGYAVFRQSASDLMFPAADDRGAVLKLSVRSSDTGALVSQIGAIAPGARVNAHVGNGVIIVDVEDGSIKAAGAITSRAAELGGGWLVLHDAARLAAEGIPMLGPPRPDWELMRQIKKTLDPAGIFATGSPFDLAIRSAPLVR